VSKKLLFAGKEEHTRHGRKRKKITDKERRENNKGREENDKRSWRKREICCRGKQKRRDEQKVERQRKERKREIYNMEYGDARRKRRE